MQAERRPASPGAPNVAFVALVVAALTGAARAADVETPEARGGREVASLTARADVLGEQAEAARAAARWRLRAVYRLVVAGGDLSAATRARALDAGTRALARELAEARSLSGARARLRSERDALAAAARGDEAIGAAPALVPPVPGPIVARFGVAPDRATGLLVAHAGVRLACAPRAAVRAPAAGRVVLVRDEPDGTSVLVDAGAGWSTIVTGLVGVAVAEGERLALGQRLGVAANGTVGLEVWRGRRPVDPALLLRTSPVLVLRTSPALVPRTSPAPALRGAPAVLAGAPPVH